MRELIFHLFPFWEWLCTLTILYSVIRHIPVVIVMNVSYISRYAMILNLGARIIWL